MGTAKKHEWSTRQHLGPMKLCVSCSVEAEAVYIIVRVRNVRIFPEILDIIVDPVKHWHDGRLAIENKDIYKYP